VRDQLDFAILSLERLADESHRSAGRPPLFATMSSFNGVNGGYRPANAKSGKD
jgi:hypothetical protein